MKKIYFVLCLGMFCACSGSVEENENGEVPSSDFAIDSSEYRT
jgi:hypothetical protein